MNGPAPFPHRARRGSLGLLLVLAATLSPAPSGAAALSPQERRGQQVYRFTTSPSGGEIRVFVGRGDTEAPGAAMPCLNCHGRNGRGRPESDVFPSNITWSELTKSYGLRHRSGREHPPYTPETLARAVTQGVDPKGNRLDPAMPRYAMSARDLEDLVAYLKIIEFSRDPGLSDETIRIGSILPSQGPRAEMGKALSRFLEAYFRELNERGGIYSRRIELHWHEIGEDPSARAEAVRRVMREGDLFALLSPFVGVWDREMVEMADAEEVPVIGPHGPSPSDAPFINRFTFFLLSGQREQARAFLLHAERELGLVAPKAAVVFDEKGGSDEVVNAVEQQAERLSWPKVTRVPYRADRPLDSQAIHDLRRRPVDLVLFFGSGETVLRWLGLAHREAWTPFAFLASPSLGSRLFDLPEGFGHRIFVASPVAPEDRAASAMREVHGLLESKGLSKAFLPAQMFGYSAAKLLVEGLKRAGRDLSREKVVNELERLYRFPTGATPPLTYGPNRRVGAHGAYFLAVDLQRRDLVPAGKWIELD